MGFFSSYAVYIAAFCAIFYGWIVSPLLWTTLGIGRKWEQTDAFGYKCTPLKDIGAEACEDMWMHEPSGLLYMACGNSIDRTHWLPAIDLLNETARTGKGRIGILDTRASGPWSKRLKWMSPINYVGATGDKSLDTHGIDISVGPGSDPMLKILINNHRPPVDPKTLKLLDAAKLGANSTLEVFSAKLGDTVLRHVKTYVHESIKTPNRPQWVGNGAFLWTNDKSTKTGWTRQLELLIGGGSVGYCDQNGCKIAASIGFNFPNGLVKGHDGLIYVPSSVTGKVLVMELQTDNTLKNLHTIKLPQPIDNMSVDSKGDIYAATFPELHTFINHQKDPYNVHPPAAVWRIRKTNAGDGKGKGLEFETVKVLEGSGEVLPGATVAVHDPKTKRFFLGGATAPFISVCEKVTS